MVNHAMLVDPLRYCTKANHRVTPSEEDNARVKRLNTKVSVITRK